MRKIIEMSKKETSVNILISCEVINITENVAKPDICFTINLFHLTLFVRVKYIKQRWLYTIIFS